MSVEVQADAYSDRLLGQTLASRYLIEVKLGEGAMGAVYKARHVKVGRAFAVKVLHPRLLEEPKTLQRFEREAELAGRVRHPNVIGVVDVGETPEGMRYMVMDFAEGPDLSSLLSETPFPPARIVNLTRQMLEGLYHAHEAGLIHRDFKPENVIIEKDTHGTEVPRIVDFGIAILAEGGDSTDGPGRLTTNGLVLGTPHYMAPEQAVADPIDHRIDLFALGIMIYEMLCGKLPFDGSGAEVARANLLLEPPPISERVPYLEVDPLLEAYARRLMAKKRDQRPATAKAARELLDLVEKDRAAAAAALGVPASEATRGPMTTQPNAPVRHASGDGTFPPPVREAASTFGAREPTPLPARMTDGALISETTAPVNRASRGRGPLIAAVLGVAVLGAGAFVVLGRDDKASPPAAPAPTPVVSAPTAPTPAPTPAPAPVAETPAPAPTAATEPAPTPEPVRVAEPAPAKTPKSPATKKPVTTAKVEAPATTTPAAAPPAPATPITASALAALYQSVGAQLSSLRQAKGADATSDLWSRYRFVNVASAMQSQQSRDDAAAILNKLAGEIRARSK